MRKERLKQLRKESQDQMGFVENPGRCANCCYRSPSKKRMISKIGEKKTVFQPDMCKKGRFPVKTYSTCDQWEPFWKTAKTVPILLVENDANNASGVASCHLG